MTFPKRLRNSQQIRTTMVVFVRPRLINNKSIRQLTKIIMFLCIRVIDFSQASWIFMNASSIKVKFFSPHSKILYALLIHLSFLVTSFSFVSIICTWNFIMGHPFIFIEPSILTLISSTPHLFRFLVRADVACRYSADVESQMPFPSVCSADLSLAECLW